MWAQVYAFVTLSDHLGRLAGRLDSPAISGWPLSAAQSLINIVMDTEQFVQPRQFQDATNLAMGIDQSHLPMLDLRQLPRNQEHVQPVGTDEVQVAYVQDDDGLGLAYEATQLLADVINGNHSQRAAQRDNGGLVGMSHVALQIFMCKIGHSVSPISRCLAPGQRDV
jgi:hypothetical protein